MLTLNLQQAQDLIAELIVEHGEDKVYERQGFVCKNVHTDDEGNLTPGCIVGHAVIKWGVTAEQIEERSVARGDAWELSSALAQADILTVDEDAQNYLRKVQERQDSGMMWGKANELALSEIRGDGK